MQFMTLQFIQDNKGDTSGVYIPIKEWEKMTKEVKDLTHYIENHAEIPQWQKDTVMKRLNEAKEEEWLDFDKTVTAIKKKI